MIRKYGTAILIVLGVLLVIMSFLIIDYSKYQKGEKPIFAYPIHYKDGGSVEYIGLGYEIIYFNMLEDRLLEDKPLKYFGPFWVSFDNAYIETVGEFYAGLSFEEKEFYGYLKDALYKEEFKILFESKKSSIYEYYYRLMDIYYTDDRLNDNHREYIFKLVSNFYDSHNTEMNDDINNKFKKFVLGREISVIE